MAKEIVIRMSMDAEAAKHKYNEAAGIIVLMQYAHDGDPLTLIGDHECIFAGIRIHPGQMEAADRDLLDQLGWLYNEHDGWHCIT